MKYREISQHVDAIKFNSVCKKMEVDFLRLFPENPDWLVENLLKNKILISGYDDDRFLVLKVYGKEDQYLLYKDDYLMFSKETGLFVCTKKQFLSHYERVWKDGDLLKNPLKSKFERIKKIIEEEGD